MMLKIMIILMLIVAVVSGCLWFLSSRSMVAHSEVALSKSSRHYSIGLYAVVIVVITGVSYAVFMYNEDRFQWYETREMLLPDIQILLNENKASEAIKALDTQFFISALGYYAKVYPQDARAWQKLSVVLVALKIPDQALKAIRRFLYLKPDDIEARYLEIQLLAELVDGQQKISPRQLHYAIQQMSKRDELSLDEQFQLAGFAHQYGFYDTAADIWENLLHTDNRLNSELNAKVQEGRHLLKKLITQARQQASEPVSTQSLPTYQVHLQWSPAALQRMTQYMVSHEGAAAKKFHVWLSVKDGKGGPPLAARLVWVDTLADVEAGLQLTFGENDLLIPTRRWKEGDKLHIQAVVALSEEKTDPLQATQIAEIKGKELVLIDQQGTQVDLQLDISKTREMNESSQSQTL